jgi:hypothetical protein
MAVNTFLLSGCGWEYGGDKSVVLSHYAPRRVTALTATKPLETLRSVAYQVQRGGGLAVEGRASG